MTNTIQEKRKAILIHGSEEVSQYYREITNLCNLELTNYNPLKDGRNKLLEPYLGLESSAVKRLLERMKNGECKEGEFLSLFRANDITAVFVDDDSLEEKSLDFQLILTMSGGKTRKTFYQSLQYLLSQEKKDTLERDFIPAIDIPKMFNLDERVMPIALQPLYLYVTKLELSSIVVEKLLMQPSLGGPGYAWVFYGEKTTAQTVGEVVNRLYDLKKKQDI